MKSIILKFGLAALVLGCEKSNEPPQRLQMSSAITAFSVSTPVTYSGTLPCADCAGLRYTLNLQPDHVFYLRQTYLGKGAGEGESFYDLGSWSLEAEGKKLALRGGREAPHVFAVKSPEVLNLLDLEGNVIQSQLNYDLTRAGQVDWFDVPLFMRGLYSDLAGAGAITECATGKTFSVAREGDIAALQAAYGEARQQPGEAVLVNFAGRIVRRPKMAGEGEQDMMIVEQFHKFWPGETCEANSAEPALEETHWKLIELHGNAAAAGLGEREAYLQLAPDEKRVAGSTGCNRVMGAYTLNGESLSFSQMATTRMACPETLMQQENAFARALEATATWKVAGGKLELLNAEGAVLARFEPKIML